MHITSLKLQYFRNLDPVGLRFVPTSIGILGDNAQGKTNLLESLYLLATGTTWRGVQDVDLVQHDAEYSRLDGVIESAEGSVNLALVLQKDEAHVKKTYIVNDIKRKRETFTRYLRVILFYPEDIALITGTPAQRRKAIDVSLGGIFSQYGYLISQYGKVVSARNRLLERVREREAKVEQLDYWTDTLVLLASQIYLYRYRFFEFIASHQDEFVFHFLPKIVCTDLPIDAEFIADIATRLREKIAHNLQKEILSATCQYGPHKDDFSFFFKEKDLSLYGSRGEQRAGLLAFKKMQLLYCERVTQDRPVLLLDDIFSEFDRKHRRSLRDLCEGYQTFVTGTEDQFFLGEEFGFEQILRVNGGKIE